MIKLVNIPDWVSGNLWFEIPKELQAAMIPYLRSKIANEVTSVHSRKEYRACLTRTSMREKYSQPIWGEFDNGGRIVFYTLYGVWRVGNRGVTGDNTLLQAAILSEILKYSISLAATN